MSKRPPNIILITTDQQRADHLGCYGASVLKTPHIDALASRGTRFENAYVASPVCMPNRASLMTGRMPSLHGVRHNGLNLDLGSMTIAQRFLDAGWNTSLSGKPHFQCVTQRPAPMQDGLASNSICEARKVTSGRYDQEVGELWQQDPSRKMDLPYYGFEHIDLAVGHGDQVSGHYTSWLLENNIDPERYRGPDNALKDASRDTVQAWRTAVPEEFYPTRYIQDKTIERLQDLSEASDKPFFHWVSFCDPHHPFTPPGKYWDMYHPDDVELPATFHEDAKTDLVKNLHDLRQGENANLNGTGALAVNEIELRAALALTYGMISMVDDAVGQIMKALSNLRMADNTIVIFMADHGDLMGEHGLIFKGPYHYQGLIRVPLIWSDPRGDSAKINSSPVSTIDVPASILDAAGLTLHNGMQGISFANYPDNQIVKRKEIYIEDEVQSTITGHSVRGRVRTLLSAGWRLTIYDGLNEGELYNLNDDPMEITNLWNDASHAMRRLELTEALLRQMIKHSETSPLPDYAA